ncbi:MAG: alpha-amylase family glycosyl hydrolase [Ruminococcus sp.]|nr:alpha-amylase family glycosyl hydrolase [Ruminococcus sp.]
MKWSNKIISSLLAAGLVMSSSVVGFSAVTTSNSEVAASSTVDFEQPDNVQEGVILHCWNWSYNNIKKYLPQIAAAGYTAVQTSPVTQPKDYYWEGTAYGNVGIPDGLGGNDGNWWKSYQPVTEEICDNGHTWYGTKAEFKAMCDEAEKYGIKVIVDIVANHMGNIKGWKIGSVEEVMGDISPQVGTFWNPDMLTDPSYWHISTSWVHSSDGRFDVTQGNMGMPDLNTGDKKVQNMILNLLKECIDNGADGFRFDAAKHIETPKDDAAFASDFWDVVLDGATSYAKSTKNFTPYYYGEVLNRIDSNAAENYYLSKMSVTDNSTGDNIRNSLKYGQVGGASNSGYCGYAHGQGNKVVLWAESHDTYMGGGSSYDCNDSTINRAWAIVASRKDSTGLYFARPFYSYERLNDDQNGYDARKDPNQMAKEIRQTQMGEVGTLTWMDTCVAEVNRFRNHFVGQSESLGNSGDSLFYNVRGNSGVVIVSTKGAGDVSVSLGGKMKDGTYTDQVSGNTFTVSGGTIKGTIGNGDGIAVVYNTTSVPRSTIEAPRENFAAESIDITVGLDNATKGTYSINGGAAVTYTKDTTFTIGAGDAIGTEYTVVLTATDGTNSTSSTYTFTKESKNVTYPTEPGYSAPTTVPATTAQPATTQPATTDTQPTTQPSNRVLIGDANLNGVITISDATAVQLHSSESSTLTGDALTAADVDKNGQINIKDATAIQYYLAELTYEGSYCGTYTGGETPTEPETTEPASKNYLYYKNTNNWSTVMAYYWSESNTNMTTWPGVATESLGNNVYRVEVPSDATFIIFNNGSDSKKTLDLPISGMNKIYENGSWSDYNG